MPLWSTLQRKIGLRWVGNSTDAGGLQEKTPCNGKFVCGKAKTVAVWSFFVLSISRSIFCNLRILSELFAKSIQLVFPFRYGCVSIWKPGKPFFKNSGYR